MRKMVVEGSEYKVVHQDLLCDLLLLSTSTYSQVNNNNKLKHTLKKSCNNNIHQDLKFLIHHARTESLDLD